MLPAPPSSISSRPVAAVVGNKRPLPPLSPPELVKKRPAAAAAPALLPVEVKVEADDEGMDEQPARKRANLDHLSADERLMRRKLKNRVAAQTARDKKKAYIDEMEEILEKMRQENEQLQKQNSRLQDTNANLQLENANLLQRNK